MSCHPECYWMCDNPTCRAECKIMYEPPVCICDGNPSRKPQCSIRCPPDQCEMNQCPNCETICEPLANCEPLCEQVVATWACRKPPSCPSPKCELQCEMPACPYGGTKDPWAIESPFPWWALAIGIFLFLIIVLSSLK